MLREKSTSKLFIARERYESISGMYIQNYNEFVKMKFHKLYRVCHTTILSILLSLLYILNSNSIINADSFYPSRDSVQCNLGFSTAFSVDALPIDGEEIFYPSGGLNLGIRGVWNLSNIARTTYPNAGRINGVYDEVVAPPLSRVSIYTAMYNYSGHPINIFKYYYSIDNPWTDDSLRMFGVLGNRDTVSYLQNGSWTTRNSTYKIIDLNRTIPTGFASPIKLFDFTLPITASYHLESSELYWDGVSQYPELNIHSRIQNMIGLPLNSIELSIYGVNEKIHLQSYENRRLDYTHTLRNTNYSPTLEYIGGIVDNDTHRVCLTRGYPLGFPSDPNYRTSFISRSDSTAPSEWSGVQPDWVYDGSKDTSCVSISPYRIDIPMQFGNLGELYKGSISSIQNDCTATITLSLIKPQFSSSRGYFKLKVSDPDIVLTSENLIQQTQDRTEFVILRNFTPENYSYEFTIDYIKPNQEENRFELYYCSEYISNGCTLLDTEVVSIDTYKCITTTIDNNCLTVNNRTNINLTIRNKEYGYGESTVCLEENENSCIDIISDIYNNRICLSSTLPIDEDVSNIEYGNYEEDVVIPILGSVLNNKTLQELAEEASKLISTPSAYNNELTYSYNNSIERVNGWADTSINKKTGKTRLYLILIVYSVLTTIVISFVVRLNRKKF